ncbi:MAG: malto-oligosyltrehalose synthase, partial [Acidimicrobiales bacterium]
MTVSGPSSPKVGAASSTYRVQLHAGFDFDAAASTAGYLAELGVTHLYCSPYLQSAPGSEHGYDVTDPTRLDHELGGGAGHARMTGALRGAGLGQLLDVVPNHMAADPESNSWWWDVLENGPASRFAPVFDIDWEAGNYLVLVPVLGDHIGRVLESGEVRVVHRVGRFVVAYQGHELPISPRTLDGLLGRAGRRAGSATLAAIAEGLSELPPAQATGREAVRTRHERKEALLARLARACRDDPALAQTVDAEVSALNADLERVDELLRRQNYRLAYWRTASEELDYRRFFDIDSLVGVRVEDPHVFELTHRLVLELVSDGTVQGLRVDHIDGLSDPAGYLDRLSRAARGAFTVVEKILEPCEELPAWPVAGTTGYDFSSRVDNLLVDPGSEGSMTSLYEEFSGETSSWDEVVHRAKLEIMDGELSVEVGRLSLRLASICDRYRRQRDHTRRELRDALEELVAHFDVYRTYVVPSRPASPEDEGRVGRALEAARRCRPDLDTELLDFLGELALGMHRGAEEAEFARRLQQVTAPVMAKGVEDTAFYRYHRLTSLNEVGGDPGT